MTLSRLIQVLRGRWRLAAAVLGGALLAAVVLSALATREYRATSSVLVDMRSSDPVVGAAVTAALGNAMGTGYMATQMDLVQSERVTLRAMKLAGLDHDATLKARWQEETDGRGSYETWVVERMRKKQEVLPTRESGVMTISFAAPDAKVAADVANAYVQAFIDTTLELRVEPAKRYTEFFDQRVSQLRAALNAAQVRLSTYQQANGLVATDERLDVETARLSELSSQLSAWQTASADSSSRQQTAKGVLPEAASDPVLIGLSGELARQELKVSDLRQRLGESHPQLQEALAGAAQLRARIAAESSRLAGGVATNNRVNQSRVEQLRAMLDEQRVKVLRMKRQRDDARVLLSDVESAKSAYDAMLARANQSGLESLNTQTNVSVLQVAVPPMLPSSPKPLANLVVALVIGGLLSVATVLVREFGDPRMRTVDDVVIDLKQKLLVVMPRGTSRGPVEGVVRARILGRLPDTSR